MAGSEVGFPAQIYSSLTGDNYKLQKAQSDQNSGEFNYRDPYLAGIHSVCVEIKRRQRHRSRNTMDMEESEREHKTRPSPLQMPLQETEHSGFNAHTNTQEKGGSNTREQKGRPRCERTEKTYCRARKNNETLRLN